MLCGRSDEGNAVRVEDIGELGVFRQEAVTGVNGVRTGDFAGRNDLVDVEVAVTRRRRADAHTFVGKAHMHGVRVCGGMHGDCRNAKLLGSAQDAQRNLAAVGYEDLRNHAEPPLFDDHESFTILHGL